MSYVDGKARNERQDKFTQLEHRKDRNIEIVGEWMDQAIILHTNTADAAEKAEVSALRQALIDGLKVKLGI